MAKLGRGQPVRSRVIRPPRPLVLNYAVTTGFGFLSTGQQATVFTGFGFADTIVMPSMSVSAQAASTTTTFKDIIGEIQQGGQLPPTDVIEYLARTSLVTPDRTYRLIAQRILDRDFLDWDLQVSDVTISFTLSGPKIIKGKLGPEQTDYLDLGLEPKATYIHIEQNGIIRGSAILQPSEMNDDGSLSFVAEGISGYPHGQPFQGDYAVVNTDPLDVVRAIWTHLLAFPRATLGLTIGPGSTNKLVGTEADVSTGSIKPYTLYWWDDTDCGREIDELAKSTPFDYIEYDEWNTAKTDIDHYILPYYPRAGSRRFDLAFVSGENIVSVALLREEPDQYASEVVVRGAGEGIESIRGFAANIVGNRIRQSVTVTDKTIVDNNAAAIRAEQELRKRQSFLMIREITILDQHDNASLGDFIPGDDILVQVELYWYGQLSLWCRVISYDWIPDKHIMVVQLQNSETFNYGAVL
jgi:hypothetical protein